MVPICQMYKTEEYYFHCSEVLGAINTKNLQQFFFHIKNKTKELMAHGIDFNSIESGNDQERSRGVNIRIPFYIN